MKRTVDFQRMGLPGEVQSQILRLPSLPLAGEAEEDTARLVIALHQEKQRLNKALDYLFEEHIHKDMVVVVDSVYHYFDANDWTVRRVSDGDTCPHCGSKNIQGYDDVIDVICLDCKKEWLGWNYCIDNRV